MISIIVPVYNVEKYLQRCVDSILVQSFGDYELILIDDGSTDASGSMCDAYAARDNRVRVYHDNNQGVSAARNHGIDVATGEWIAFIDSDDYILPDYLQSMYHNTEKFDCDLVMTGIKRLYEDNASKVIIREWQEGVYNVDELDKLYDLKILQYQKGPVIKLFKRSIINDYALRFNDKVRSGEDALFVYSYLAHVQSISVAPGANYVYYKRGGSLTSEPLARFDAEYYACKCTESVILQLLETTGVKHPYPKEYLAYRFDRAINSLYKPKGRYGFRERIKLLKTMDLHYYNEWKRPLSWQDNLLKRLLCDKWFVLYDIVSRLSAK